MNVEDEIKLLSQEQLLHWRLLRENTQLLSNIQTKNLCLSGGAEVSVQFNPERIRSSTAQVDAQSIADRPCFLCAHQRPQEQRALSFKGKYEILLNPYPIFNGHLTIVHQQHILQSIGPHISTMLELACSMPSFTLFFNGAKCGASAPDHFHFQAVIKGQLPVEQDFMKSHFVHIRSCADKVSQGIWRNYHRGVLSLFSYDKKALVRQVLRTLSHLKHIENTKDEPMVNILAYWEEGVWLVHIFPRKAHRPKQYFATGNKQILFSPASIDLGGVLIVSRQEDFDRLGVSEVEDIFQQVSRGIEGLDIE